MGKGKTGAGAKDFSDKSPDNSLDDCVEDCLDEILKDVQEYEKWLFDLVQSLRQKGIPNVRLRPKFKEQLLQKMLKLMDDRQNPAGGAK